MKGHRDQFVRGNWTFENDVVVKGSIDVEGPALNALYGGGKKYYVNSNKGTIGDGKSWSHTIGTINEAVGKCTDDNGDIIFVAAGHVETVIAAAGLDLDVKGITIIFLGEPETRGYITFTTAVTADMDVDAEGITMINPKFVAGIDALTGPIDVNDNDFTIINGEWHDAASKNTVDCVIADANATGLKIDGWRFFKSDEAGTQKQSAIQLNGVDDCVLKNIDILGDFATGIIENITDECLNIKLENIFLNNTNATPKPCLVLDSNCDGWASNVHLRVASGTTYVSDLSDINWDGLCLGYSTDGYTGESIGTAVGGSIEAQVSQAVSEIGSVGVKASTTVSTGTIVSSKVTSVGTKASTAISKVNSVGVKASTTVSTGTVVSSKVTSVGTKASTAISKVNSVGVKASTTISTGTIVSSKVTSVGTKASTAISKANSIGVKTSTVISKINSLYTFLSTRLSLIDSQVT